MTGPSPSAPGDRGDDERDRLWVWWLDAGALVWSAGLIVVGLAISTPANITQNAKGDIISTGGTSLLVPFGTLALGMCIIVTQITARQHSTRFMPVAWVLAGGLTIGALIAIASIGPSLVPPAFAVVAACYFARRRALSQGE